MRQATNCFLIDKDGRVLLAMKKRGFGVGKWNGAGGKVAPDESVTEAAIREIHEEIGVTVSQDNLEKVAENHYSKTDDPNWGMNVHIFLTRKWHGQPKETEEMKPEWFEPDEIPFGEAWEDMVHWLPRLLVGEKLRATFMYKIDGESIEGFEVKMTPSF